MKIAAPLTAPLRETLVVARTQPASVSPQLVHTSSAVEEGTSPLQVARFATALVQQSRNLRQRDVLTSTNALQSRAVKMSELYRQLMSGQDKSLDDAARSLRTQLKSAQPPITELLEQMDGDAAKTYVTLQAAAKQALSEKATEEHVMLSQQLKLMRHAFGGQARAGINSARAFSRSRLEPRRRAALRKMYSDVATGYQSISQLIETLLDEQSEPDQFESTLRELRSALADDLAAVAPSSSERQLRTFMHGLNTSRHVAILMRSCEHLLGRMRIKNPALGLVTAELLKKLMSMCNKGLGFSETLQLTRQIGGEQLKHQLSFLNGLRPLLQQLPILIWREVKVRQTVLDNMLLVMAELTQQEQRETLENIA